MLYNRKQSSPYLHNHTTPPPQPSAHHTTPYSPPLHAHTQLNLSFSLWSPNGRLLLESHQSTGHVIGNQRGFGVRGVLLRGRAPSRGQLVTKTHSVNPDRSHGLLRSKSVFPSLPWQLRLSPRGFFPSCDCDELMTFGHITESIKENRARLRPKLNHRLFYFVHVFTQDLICRTGLRD